MSAPSGSKDPLQESLDDAPRPKGDGRELALARRAQEGDREALDELFTRYQEPLRRIVGIRMGAHLRGPGGLESMDVVQRTFVKACTRLPEIELRGGRSILNWLARIAERQIKDVNDNMSAQKRDWQRTSPLNIRPNDSKDIVQLEASATLPDDKAQRNELKTTIDEAMQELSPDHREVILLREYLGLEWPGVVDEMGRNDVHSTQELHRRARLKLAAILAARLGDDW